MYRIQWILSIEHPNKTSPQRAKNPSTSSSLVFFQKKKTKKTKKPKRKEKKRKEDTLREIHKRFGEADLSQHPIPRHSFLF